MFNMLRPHSFQNILSEERKNSTGTQTNFFFIFLKSSSLIICLQIMAQKLKAKSLHLLPFESITKSNKETNTNPSNLKAVGELFAHQIKKKKSLSLKSAEKIQFMKMFTAKEKSTFTCKFLTMKYGAAIVIYLLATAETVEIVTITTCLFPFFLSNNTVFIFKFSLLL